MAWTFDPTQYEEKSFQVIPAGDYRVRIADVEQKRFNSGNEGYEITLDVNGFSSKLWYYLVLNASDPKKTNQKIGEFFNSFGIQNTAMGTGKQWVGAVGAVRVRHEEYNGQTQAKVAYVLSKSRQDGLAPWSGGNTTVATPTFSALPDYGTELPFN